MNILSIIAKILVTPAIFMYSLAGYQISPKVQTPLLRVDNSQYEQKIRSYINEYVDQSLKNNESAIKLGAAPDYFAGTTFFIAGSGISSSVTNITLTSLTLSQTGQKIITSDLIAGVGNKFYVTIEPGNRLKQEVSSCTTITQNANNTATLGGCSRGLSPITPYTASTTLQFVHSGGSQVIFSNPPNVYRDLVSYVDAATVAGAVDSSLTAKGIVEKATGNEAASHAVTGSGNTSAPLGLTTDIASSTRVANTSLVVVSSSTDGYIDNSFINISTLVTQLASSTRFTNGILFTNIGKNRFVYAPGTSTFTPSNTGATSFFYIICGAGGGAGGGTGTGVTSGGGAGSCAEGYLATTTAFQVVVGSKGTGGASGGANNGNNGGASSIGGNVIVANGGSGSNGQSSAVNQSFGTGGTATGGDINITGQNGTPGTSITLSGATTIPGGGGSCPFGFGGTPGLIRTSGLSATGYCAGGAGSTDNSSAGGNGADGFAIISW